MTYILLSSINKPMDILGHGKIISIKFQVRTDIEDLKPSTLRYLKRKATTTVHEALDCIAPSQTKKLLQFLHIDKHRTYVHTIESAKQDWYSVTSVIEHTLKTIKDQMPNIKSVVLRSDNAGCYHCNNLWHSLHGISQRTGLFLAKALERIHQNSNSIVNDQVPREGDLYCPEMTCSRKFKSYSELEDHCFVGDHALFPTHDLIKLQWKGVCLDISSCSVKTREGSLQNGDSTLQSGWGLKRDRKSVRFSLKTKNYLKEIFDSGEKNGQKANAGNVAKNMRISRDNTGKKIFSPHEYFQPSQIVSYFHRLTCWKAFGIGEVQRITMSSFNQEDTNFNVLEDFSLPKHIEGSIKNSNSIVNDQVPRKYFHFLFIKFCIML
ncbi:unnamed protein product [Mytilus coruscus]|uniref:C2H2-type domain-containing protein n=1 Tax=Mytilus coruscus TaxID=42192 RepID=A0A6J8A3Y2_MYTCO|nr:unnamed protein product [Mytilus coruscus]